MLLFYSCGNSQKETMQEAYCPLQIGMNIPGDIQVKDVTGKDITLNTIIDETPTILLFYRGGW